MSGDAAPPPDGAVDVLRLEEAAELARGTLGAKAEAVVWLAQRDYPVSDGFVVLPDFLRRLSGTADGAAAPYPWHAAMAGLGQAMARLSERAGKPFGGGDAALAVSVRPSFLADSPGHGNRYLEIGAPAGTRAGGEAGDLERATTCLARHRDRLRGLLPAPWNGGAHLDLAAALAATADDGPSRRSAVVQVMAPFKGMPRSGRGTALSVDPISGTPGLFGEYAPGGAGGLPRVPTLARLREELPGCYERLHAVVRRLHEESGCGDAGVEVEFVVSAGRLHVFQFRSPRASPLVATAPPTPRFVPSGSARQLVVGWGDPVSPGLCRARLWEAGGPPPYPGKVALLVDELSALDATALDDVAAVLARRGGRYGHAAARLRARGVPALTAVTDLPRDVRLANEITVDAYRGVITTESAL